MKNLSFSNINVTKTYLPNKEKFKYYIDRIYENCWLTNNGELLQELEVQLKNYLKVKNLILVTNGSLALQLAYKALELTGEVITTPFSFAATTNTLLWEGLSPIFSDINPESLNIDPYEIEKKISANVSAIVPVHVFGNPCKIEKIQEIANKYKLKVIYDAAHAFGVQYKDKSILNYGDISIVSFHATKLFHTIEGGAIVTNDDEIAKKIRLLSNFGISGQSRIELCGINAKMNEFQAAMGLCVITEMDNIKKKRKKIWDKYFKGLSELVIFQKLNHHTSNNFAYAPILLKNETQCLKIQKSLNTQNVFPRRYFYPSLDTLPYIVPKQIAPISREIASRILCLPIYPSLKDETISKIINIIKSNLKE